MSMKNDNPPDLKSGFDPTSQSTAQQKFSTQTPNPPPPDIKFKPSEELADEDIAFKAEPPYTATPGIPNAELPAINDSPASTDSIGFTPYVTALSRLICHADTQTPLTIGLYGPWGSGKSSFMEQVYNDIRQNKPSIQQIKFNAWKHDARDNLWLVFLQTLLVQLENLVQPENKTPLFAKYIKRFLFLMKSASKIRLILNSTLLLVIIVYLSFYLGPDISASFQASNNGRTIERVLIQQSPAWLSSLLILVLMSPNLFNTIRSLFMPIGVNLSRLLSINNFVSSVQSIEGFTDCFDSIVEFYVGRESRLVIYIDDLDRCSPENAVTVIETINILLKNKQSVFVLGIDRDKLTLSVETHYRDLLELDQSQQQWNSKYKSLIHNNQRFGEQFMEKMIQLPIAVPHPGHEDIKSFASQLVYDKKPSTNSSHTTTSTQTDNTKNITIDLKPDVKISLVELISLLERNPRSIKRFYNTYRFVNFLFILNSEQFPGLDELALPYWYFIYYQYGEKIAEVYRKKIWNQPDEHSRPLRDFFRDIAGEIPELDAFFQQVEADTSEWAVLYNSGRPVRSFYRLTRAIFY